MPMTTVPVIDVRPFLEGGAADKRRVATQIRDACEQIGFFTIVGHGVPMASYEAMRAKALEFFALPEDLRMKSAQPASKVSRGYSAQASRALAYSMGDATPPDLQQSYAMGPIEAAPAYIAGTEAATRFFMPNYWPAAPEGFQAAFEDYYGRANALAGEVLRMFAVALDLDERYFDDKIDQHTSTMRALLYPAQSTPPLEGQLRAGAHTDYGALTILRGDDVPGGLQVRLRSGEWIDVHPAPDSFVCNIGDLMMRWTNDRWLSNVHRVANPPPAHAGTPRFSVAFFHNPNFDAEIRCIDPSAPTKYEPMPFGELFLGKHLKTQNMTKSEAA